MQEQSAGKAQKTKDVRTAKTGEATDHKEVQKGDHIILNMAHLYYIMQVGIIKKKKFKRKKLKQHVSNILQYYCIDHTCSMMMGLCCK